MAKNLIWVIGIAIVAVIGLNAGWFSSILGDSTQQQQQQPIQNPNIYPSDLETTVTLNTKDALASTATDANVTYYVFKSTGDYLKSGTTSAGTGSFDVPYAGNYIVLAYDDDASGVDYLPEEVSFTADGEDKGLKTVNMELKKESNATVSTVRDSVDLNGNVTTGLGVMSNFDVIFKATTSNAAVGKPVIVLDVNNTCVDDVYMNSLTKATCPSRLLGAATDSKLYCYGYGKDVKASDGVVIVPGALLFDSSTACPSAAGSEGMMKVFVLDQTYYKDANYATAGKTAFHIDSEDKGSASNVGATDSNVERLGFAG